MDKPICSFEGCEKEKHAKDLCAGHYQQGLKGQELHPLGKRSMTHRMTDAERFAFYTRKSGGCWVWAGNLMPDGYGRIRFGGAFQQVHRISYQLEVGPIPAGAQIDHTCHNRACINPDHLRIVTNKQNQENQSGSHVGSRSSHRGVSWYSKTGKWRAQIGHNYKLIHLGYFDDEQEAARVVEQKRMELFTHSDGR